MTYATKNTLKGQRLVRTPRLCFALLLRWFYLMVACLLAACIDVTMPERSYSGKLPPLSDTEQTLRDRLRDHVEVLAGQIGERNLSRPKALHAASRYIRTSFETMGYRVIAQEYRVGNKAVHNLIAPLPGRGVSEDIVVVGAHYDSVWGSPGANDNATGMAAVLEIARLVAAESAPTRTIHFVAFVNEEPPYFQTDQMGSRVYARRARQNNEHIVAMLSLETIGYYDNQADTQNYPFPLDLVYPSEGNFIGFVGNPASSELLYRCISGFRKHKQFPSEGVVAPPWITGVDWSDHGSFWEQGYPAIMVTDTALFRYPHYHRREDTPDKIDYESLARVVSGLTWVVMDLAR